MGASLGPGRALFLDDKGIWTMVNANATPWSAMALREYA